MNGCSVFLCNNPLNLLSLHFENRDGGDNMVHLYKVTFAVRLQITTVAMLDIDRNDF